MAAEALGATRPAGDGPAREIDAPLLSASLLDRDGHRVFTGALSESDWVIGEHRLASGEALLPGTGYLELIAEALAAQGESAPWEIRDLAFLRPLAIAPGERREIRLRLRRSAAGYRVDIRSAVEMQGRKGFVLNAEAEVALGNIPAADTADLAAIRARCAPPEQAAPGAALASAQEAHLAFGPRWKVLQSQSLGEGEGIADLTLPEAARGDLAEGFALHPALLDIATGWAMALIPGYAARHLWVPLAYRRLRLYRPLPAEITSHIRLAEARPGAPDARFDVTLCDRAGNVCAEIEGFTIRRIDSPAALDLEPAPAPEAVEFPDAPNAPAGGAPLSPAQERLRHNLGQGIPAEQGGKAFLAALAAGRSRLLVSSMPLEALIEQTDAEAEAAHGASGGRTFERPRLEQEYIAPEGALEETLAGFWQDLLGVGRIGAEDSFFDLGGHSLIAVRLFARIRKSWGVDLPISTLFEAPSIRALARLLEAEGAAAEAGDSAAEKPRAPRRRFTHLVPMHEGEGGEATPFFLVAGMFGNVLNLRHLAHLLGHDRPFYGLQARGLLGEDEPHDSIPEAARSMIAEIRQIQPHGPYLLGGFSGGGITAYEIARQLEALGEEVALVVLLDTPLPQRRPLSRRDRALIQLQELYRHGPGYIGRWAVNRVKWELARRRRRTGEAPGADAAPRFHNAAIEAAFLTAIARYRMQPWAGNLVLFRPPLVGKWKVSQGRWVNSERAYLFEDNDWGQWAAGLRVQEVPGDHDSMVLEPNVRVLAAHMRREIEAAEAAARRDDRRAAAAATPPRKADPDPTAEAAE